MKKQKKPKIRVPLPKQAPYIKISKKAYNRKRKHKNVQDS